MLLLNINRKSQIGSLLAPLHLTCKVTQILGGRKFVWYGYICHQFISTRESLLAGGVSIVPAVFLVLLKFDKSFNLWIQKLTWKCGKRSKSFPFSNIQYKRTDKNTLSLSYLALVHIGSFVACTKPSSAAYCIFVWNYALTSIRVEVSSIIQ